MFQVGRIKLKKCQLDGSIPRLRGDEWTEAKAEGMKLQGRTMVFISPPCLALGTGEPAWHPRVGLAFRGDDADELQGTILTA